jgi:hypothetical protein
MESHYCKLFGVRYCVSSAMTCQMGDCRFPDVPAKNQRLFKLLFTNRRSHGTISVDVWLYRRPTVEKSVNVHCSFQSSESAWTRTSSPLQLAGLRRTEHSSEIDQTQSAKRRERSSELTRSSSVSEPISTVVFSD